MFSSNVRFSTYEVIALMIYRTESTINDDYIRNNYYVVAQWRAATREPWAALGVRQTRLQIVLLGVILIETKSSPRIYMTKCVIIIILIILETCYVQRLRTLCEYGAIKMLTNNSGTSPYGHLNSKVALGGSGGRVD